MKKIKQGGGIGFRPDLITTYIQRILGFVIYMFRINGKNSLSNEFIQKLNPKKSVIFDSKEIWFKTGHGRLEWRVDTFHTEEPIMIRWLSTFSKDDVFFDVGANVGTYTLPALIKGSAVFSFELDPINVSILHENIFINKLNENSTIIPIGLSDSSKIEKVYNRDFSKGDALQSVGRPSPFDTVQNNPFVCNQLVAGLDYISGIFDFPVPTKIKIDVDGNEKMVFDGGVNTILSAQEIYFEDNGLAESKYVIDKILKNGFIEKERELSKNENLKNQFNIIFVKGVG